MNLLSIAKDIERQPQAVIMFSDLREKSGMEKETFDREIIRMHDGGFVFLHHHVHPYRAEKQGTIHQLVPDPEEKGRFYCGLVIRKDVEPFGLLLRNRKTIIPIIEKAGNLPKAWDEIKTAIPEIESFIRFNTFKQYAKILSTVDTELSRKDTEIERLKGEIERLKNDSPAIPDKKPEILNHPEHFKGWQVRQKRKYLELVKRIDSRFETVYVGTVWNPDKAEKGIEKKLAKLGKSTQH